VDTGRDGLQRFFMKDVSGSILPGKTKEFVFNFKSEKPGVFAEKWTFTGTPNVPGTQHEILLKGVCVAEDLTRAKRAELEARLAASQRDHTVEEIVNEVVEHIGTPRTKPRVLAEDPDVDRQVFIAQNKEAQIYYSNTTLKLFRSLADSTFELLNFPMELRKWDSSLNSLKRLLYAIEDDYERERHIVQFNEIMKNAGIPPTSTAMFNSICYELVSELADSIPDIAEGIRKKLVLPKKNLQPKREEGEVEGEEFGKQGAIIMEERILTYTTEPPPPRGEMDLWHYDNHLLRIGGPPIEWFYLEGQEPKQDPVTGEDRVGNIKLKKKLMVEMWENADAADAAEGGEGEGEDAEALPDKPAGTEGRDSEVCSLLRCALSRILARARALLLLTLCQARSRTAACCMRARGWGLARTGLSRARRLSSSCHSRQAPLPGSRPGALLFGALLFAHRTRAVWNSSTCCGSTTRCTTTWRA
jgi:hypothetical protein